MFSRKTRVSFFQPLNRFIIHAPWGGGWVGGRATRWAQCQPSGRRVCVRESWCVGVCSSVGGCGVLENGRQPQSYRSGRTQRYSLNAFMCPDDCPLTNVLWSHVSCLQVICCCCNITQLGGSDSAWKINLILYTVY